MGTEADQTTAFTPHQVIGNVFACSYRAPAIVTADVESEFNRTVTLLRSLPCDVPLGDHPTQS